MARGRGRAWTPGLYASRKPPGPRAARLPASLRDIQGGALGIRADAYADLVPEEASQLRPVGPEHAVPPAGRPVCLIDPGTSFQNGAILAAGEDAEELRCPVWRRDGRSLALETHLLVHRRCKLGSGSLVAVAACHVVVPRRAAPPGDYHIARAPRPAGKILRVSCTLHYSPGLGRLHAFRQPSYANWA